MPQHDSGIGGPRHPDLVAASDPRLRLPPLASWPIRAALGDPLPLAAMLALGAAVFFLVTAWLSRRFAADAARSLGKSMRIFKSEIREMQTDNKDTKAETPSIETAAAAPQPVQSPGAESPAASEQGHTEARPA